jgi:acyl dehydratase
MMGLLYDEIEAGQRFDLGSHRFEREAMLAFSRRWDPQRFHVSDEEARASHFGELAASGWHTAAGWMKCFVATVERLGEQRRAQGVDVPALGPSPGFTELRWIKPVYAGDAISYRLVITGKALHERRPEWGIVTFDTEGSNEQGETVFSFRGRVLVRR